MCTAVARDAPACSVPERSAAVPTPSSCLPRRALQRWSWAARSAWSRFAVRCSSAARSARTSSPCRVGRGGLAWAPTSRRTRLLCPSAAFAPPSLRPPRLPILRRGDARLRRRGHLCRRHVHRRLHGRAVGRRPHPPAVCGLLPGAPGLCASEGRRVGAATARRRCGAPALLLAQPTTRLRSLQGGTHWTHWAYVLESAVAAMRQADAAAQPQRL